MEKVSAIEPRSKGVAKKPFEETHDEEQEQVKEFAMKSLHWRLSIGESVLGSQTELQRKLKSLDWRSSVHLALPNEQKVRFSVREREWKKITAELVEVNDDEKSTFNRKKGVKRSGSGFFKLITN